ncbi:Uncharacterized protein PBTT_10016 [Plasmodiophora brassicae]
MGAGDVDATDHPTTPPIASPSPPIATSYKAARYPVVLASAPTSPPSDAMGQRTQCTTTPPAGRLPTRTTRLGGACAPPGQDRPAIDRSARAPAGH